MAASAPRAAERWRRIRAAAAGRPATAARVAAAVGAGGAVSKAAQRVAVAGAGTRWKAALLAAAAAAAGKEAARAAAAAAGVGTNAVLEAARAAVVVAAAGVGTNAVFEAERVAVVAGAGTALMKVARLAVAGTEPERVAAVVERPAVAAARIGALSMRKVSNQSLFSSFNTFHIGKNKPDARLGDKDDKRNKYLLEIKSRRIRPTSWFLSRKNGTQSRNMFNNIC